MVSPSLMELRKNGPKYVSFPLCAQKQVGQTGAKAQDESGSPSCKPMAMASQRRVSHVDQFIDSTAAEDVQQVQTN